MNGKFFILDTSDNIASMNGKYLSHYNDTWVISKEPERSANATAFGSADEWEALFDIVSETWIPVPEKDLYAPTGTPAIVAADIVDVNVIGPLVDYVARYRTNANDDDSQSLFYRDRNIDGVFSTANYSTYFMGTGGEDWNYADSILGPYNGDEKYIKQFNNSVILYNNDTHFLRMVVIGNAVVSFSYAVGRNRIGVILIPFGDLQEDYIFGAYFENDKIYLITKNSTGYIRVIRIGQDIPDRIVRMAQYVHRINTLDALNILVERETRITLEHGSLDWNNKFEIENNIQNAGSQDLKTYHVNSGYNPLYEITGLRSSSMFISNTVFTLYGILYNQPVKNGYNIKFINAVLPNAGIDVFFSETTPPKYRYSIINGRNRFNSWYEDLDFPAGVIAPFPIGTKWSMHNELTAVGEMSLGLMAAGLTDSNKTLDLYPFAYQIYFGRDVFVLFGVQYIFDGDHIYLGDEKIAMAFGYIFIGSDNQIAYFYNPWDKSIYTYTGSRTLAKSADLSNRADVKTGRYDGFSGEMILLTDEEILKQREGVIMNYRYSPGDNIIPTKRGPYIKLADGRRVLHSPINGDADVFEVATEYFGIDGSTVCDYERIDIRLFSPGKKPLKFEAEMQTLNQDTKESEKKIIDLKASDWSVDGYKTVKLIPQYKKGTGLSLRLFSEQEIFVAEMVFSYSPAARTANGARSGF
jgi:hypothetical protein